MADSSHLLIVDDDPTFGRILKRSLERRGWHCTAVTNEADALGALQQQHYDRAVLDLKLAEESGLAVLESMLAKQPGLAVVMLTGYSSIATAVQAIKAGAVNYLCKPADADELMQAFQTDAPPQTTVPEQPPSVDRLAWEHIQKVLQAHDGNISATARALGMHRRTLQRKLGKKPVRQ